MTYKEAFDIAMDLLNREGIQVKGPLGMRKLSRKGVVEWAVVFKDLTPDGIVDCPGEYIVLVDDRTGAARLLTGYP